MAKAVNAFELFHGIALTKLIRSEQPIRLKLLTTNGSEWAAYQINDFSHLFIKHSALPREVQRPELSMAWRFTFSPQNLQHLHEWRDDGPVFVALVCGSDHLKDLESMHICLLDETQLDQLVDVHQPAAQWIRVRYPLIGHRMSLRVAGSAGWRELIVPRNRFEKWRAAEFPVEAPAGDGSGELPAYKPAAERLPA
jgi:hypothetical protein